uniref:SCP domain-containing protein n=1 Tax=Mesocestoides corti TaxID=53468 RepID=A0A5K3EHB0_MESCO
MMRKLICITVLFLNALAEVPSQQEREYIMKLHSELREEVDPPASNMLMLSYSSELEKLAGSWMATCNPTIPDTTQHPEYNDLGHVIKIGAINRTLRFEDLSSVKEEKPNFDSGAGTCKGWCYNYKQVIWANATEIGCARHRCLLGGINENYFYFVACLYRPTKNHLDTWPYERGVSCSKCPEGYICDRKQCTKQAPQTSTLATTSVSTRNSAFIILNSAMFILLCMA